MANILIKAGALFLLLVSLCSPIPVKADSGSLKQCFYIITKSHDSKSVKEDLDTFGKMGIPVFVIIDPDEAINQKVIEVLETFQKETKLQILLENKEELMKSNFAVKGYDHNLNLSGLCDLKKDSLVYIGKNNISFDLIEIGTDPLATLTQIKEVRERSANFALVVRGDRLNRSTLLLVYNDLEGQPLEVSGYSLSIGEPAFIYKVFTYVGDASLILFSVAIVIFVAAIIIFRKWSREKFLD